jgi:hypothetical protein
MNSLNSELEVGYVSLNKIGEELCGDHVELIKKESGAMTVVLADGLGSGVKANILSTLTSSMLSTMINGGLSLKEAVSSLVRTLPVAKDRGNVAYSTFTVVHANDDFSLSIYNYDNPEPILLHEGKNVPLLWEHLSIEGKAIATATVELEDFDSLVLLSDGVVYAGVGETLNFGWTRKEIVTYLEGIYAKAISSKSLSTLLLDRANTLYNRLPGDDATVLTLRRRPRVNVNYLVGPATHPEDDAKVMSLFFSKGGKHLVSGGTSAYVVSRYLGQKIETSLAYEDPEIPPISAIKGVDLVTEGVITLNKLVELAKDYLGDNQAYFRWSYQQDGASLLAQALFEEATDISFYVGCAVNPAHQDPSLHINISTKMELVSELTKSLQLMGKHIKVAYF